MITRRSAARPACRRRAVAAVARAQTLEGAISRAVFAVVPAENASGTVDRYAPFVDYLPKSSAPR